MEYFFFYIFSTLLIFSSFSVVFSYNAVYSVLALVMCFVSATGLLLLLELEYLGLLLIIVYVGAIAVLFLFVVIILNLKINFKRNFNLRIQFIFFNIILGFLFLSELLYWALSEYSSTLKDYPYSVYEYFVWINEISNKGDLYLFGQTLYSYYFIYYLVAGFLLLVAILGAVSLTMSRSNQYEKSFVNQTNSYQISKDSNFSVFFLDKKLLYGYVS